MSGYGFGSSEIVGGSSGFGVSGSLGFSFGSGSVFMVALPFLLKIDRRADDSVLFAAGVDHG